MNDLLKVFGCDNIQELYDKVDQNDSSVKELNDFISYIKNDYAIEKKDVIDSDPKLMDYLSKNITPENEKWTVIFCDSKLKPNGVYEFKKYDAKEIAKEAIKNKAVTCFIGVFDTRKKIELLEGHFSSNIFFERDEFFKTKSVLETIGVPIVNEFFVDIQEETFRSHKDPGVKRKVYPLQKKEQVKINEEITLFDFIKDDRKSYEKYLNYEEFMMKYASEKVKGLNLVSDREELYSILKTSFQHLDHEKFCVLYSDINQDVLYLKELNVGTINTCMIDQNRIFRNVAQNKNIIGIELFHNHPSGDVNPSREDIGLTKRIEQIATILDVKIYDHFIVGKEGVYSLNENHKDIFFNSYEKPSIIAKVDQHKKDLKQKKVTRKKGGIWSDKEYTHGE